MQAAHVFYTRERKIGLSFKRSWRIEIRRADYRGGKNKTRRGERFRSAIIALFLMKVICSGHDDLAGYKTVLVN